MNTHRRNRRSLAVAGPVATLAAVLAVGMLAGCGRDDEEVPPVPSSPSESPSPPPNTTPPSPTPSGEPAPPRRVTVRGLVSSGVEPGCLLLTAEPGGGYLLVGGDRSVLRPGRMVEVVGVLEPGLLTTCQQGVPLKVHQAKPL